MYSVAVTHNFTHQSMENSSKIIFFSSGLYGDQEEQVQDTLKDVFTHSMMSWKPDVSQTSLSWSLFPAVHKKRWWIYSSTVIPEFLGPLRQEDDLHCWRHSEGKEELYG